MDEMKRNEKKSEEEKNEQVARDPTYTRKNCVFSLLLILYAGYVFFLFVRSHLFFSVVAFVVVLGVDSFSRFQYVPSNCLAFLLVDISPFRFALIILETVAAAAAVYVRDMTIFLNSKPANYNAP